MKVTFTGRKNLRAEVILSEWFCDFDDSCVDELSISFDHDRGEVIPGSDFRVLIMWEPRCVIPWQYNSANLKKFDLVIPMSLWRARELGFPDFAFQPYDPVGGPISPWRNRQRKIVMINAAKFSAITSSNYGLRRRTLLLMEKSGLDFELYGFDWTMSKKKELVKRLIALREALMSRNRISVSEVFGELFSRYPKYRGSIEDKSMILQDSEMVLVIENENDDVTEKIFDAIWAGAIPVYVGPDIGEMFPELENCLIRCDAKEERIVSKIMELTPQELNERKVAINNYLNLKGRQGIEFWSSDAIWSSVAEIISKKLCVHGNTQSRF